MSVYDPSSMSPRQTVAVVLPPADEQLSCSANPLAHVCCAAVAPCPGCKYCTIAQLCALVIGIAAILLLSPKNVDLSGIVHDTCTVPKFKKQN